MKTYIGTKVVKALPLSKSRFEFIKSRGFSEFAFESLPVKDVDNPEEGYFVVYEDGYKSWSPKGTFEEAYREVPEDEAEARLKAVGFWGRFASRRGQERDEAIRLLRESDRQLDEIFTLANDEGHGRLRDSTLILANKLEQFLKRFTHVQ